jgi:hypothetical protein
MTTLESRILGCQKRIDKLTSKIDRLTRLINNKKLKIASGKEEGNKYPNGSYWLEGEIEWHLEDIKRAEGDLKHERKQLSDYINKRNIEISDLENIPNVQVVEEFLNNWKNKTIAYYIGRVEALRQFKVDNKDVEYDERMKLINKNFRKDIQHYESYGREYKEKLVIDIERDLIAKRIDLYKRCADVVGIITDASGLYCGMDGNINGYVVGDRNRAIVETIGAGGYNIQQYHYRVLVKECK